MRLSAPRLAVSAAVIGTAAVTASVAFAAAGPGDPAPVTKAGAPTATSDPVVHTFSDISTSAVEQYWTPARMRAAKPVSLPKTVQGTAATPVAEASAQTGDVPAAPVGGTVASGDVSTAAVVGAKQWSNQKSGIARTTGRIYFSRGGSDYVCSGTVVNAANKRTVWTAAHCLHSGGPKGVWHRNVLFVPGYRDGKSPLGRYAGLHGAVTPQWVNSTNANYRFAHDLATFTVGNSGGKRVQARTGAQGIVWGYKKRTYAMRAFGYPVVFLPSNKRTQGHRLYYCSGTTKGIRFHAKAPVSMSLACTMGGGASGGSWLYGMNSKGWGKVAGVNSTHSTQDNRMFSPYQGAAAQKLYNYIKNR
ncbi:hypothetical protein SAMN04489712_105154 [Thermomonospora echinospora]|uniref:V8-like Glu-specific endopeptidase n=1 Tax=Thermomonospora echinospora TaxID=1992 RepID=A0A1H6A1U0_9ACTN|nr:hypothetical protein [Thermomonospora echinospora]SEG42699.1 hypothetical protein SAMN04489712_105154 [Thermomonospora echinospora]